MQKFEQKGSVSLAHTRSMFIIIVFLLVISPSYGCSLSIHGELVGCTGVPPTEFLSNNMYKVPSMFSVLELGGAHACAIRYLSGRVLCWTTGAMLQSDTGSDSLNVGSDSTNTGPADAPVYITDARALSLGLQHSCALWGVDNRLTCWGFDIALSSPADVSYNVLMLAVGHPSSRHVCFLYVSMLDVSCIGRNEKGQLGLGSTGSAVTHVPAEYIVSYM
jgi:hypothetical protein